MKILELYLIAATNSRYFLFSPTDVIEAFEAESGDHVQQFIGWFMRHRNRIVAWVGRVLHAGHGYYVRLEDRIDPVERVLKTMACTKHFLIHYAGDSQSTDIRNHFEGVLRKQRLKHSIWFLLDVIVSGIVVVFTPFLAPIPGPNVFFYYPFLRVLSHYRAIRGATSGLNSRGLEFKSLPELGGLEENLRKPRSDRVWIRAFAERLKIRGLEQFLERMV